MSKADDIVKVVLKELDDRKGFDEFWSGIDEDIQQEIMATLAEKVQVVLDK